MEILKIILTSVASIATLFILTKLMGNKQVSQLSMFDYIIGISIGSIAAEFSTELENPERSITAMAVYAIIAYLVSVVTEKSVKLRKLIIGRPLILFDKGKLYRKNLKKSRIDTSDFLTQCRNQGYFNLSDIRTAVFEYNGSLSILPAENKRPVSPQDMNLAPEQSELMTNVIIDGQINSENLKSTGNDLNWLQNQISSQGYTSEKDILLGIFDITNNSVSFYPKDTEELTFDPFE